MDEHNAKDRMLAAALELFHAKGVNATGISEVLKKSDTGKGQFTHYFKNKDGLIRGVVEFLFAIIREGRASTGYDLATWEDFTNWFQTYIDYQKSVNYKNSCPIGTIGNDLSDKQEIIRQDIRIFLEWTRGKLARFFAERKAAGDLVETADPDALADLCIAVMQGGMLMTKIRRDPDIFENSAKQTLAFIEQLKTRSQ